MRNLWIIPAVLLLLTAASCKRKRCLTYGVGGLELKNTSVTVTDTAIILIQYNKNSGFSRWVDSNRYILQILPQQSMFFTLPWGNLQNGAYDYKLVFEPSGRTLRIGNIFAEDNTGNNGMSCVNPVHYTVNDTLNTVPGYLGMESFYLPVNY